MLQICRVPFMDAVRGTKVRVSHRGGMDVDIPPGALTFPIMHMKTFLSQRPYHLVPWALLSGAALDRPWEMLSRGTWSADPCCLHFIDLPRSAHLSIPIASACKTYCRRTEYGLPEQASTTGQRSRCQEWGARCRGSLGERGNQEICYCRYQSSPTALPVALIPVRKSLEPTL